MATERVTAVADEQITMRSSDLQALISTLVEQQREATKALVDAVRTPILDPIKEAQKARAKANLIQAQKDLAEQASIKAASCNHLRDDMTCCIAWATQSDNITRGVCQHCNTLFSPIRIECIDDQVWESYKPLRRIPTQKGASINYVTA